jgi:hypothetical protein
MLGVVIGIGRRRVVGRPRLGNRFVLILLLEVYIENVNLRPDGPLGESEGSLVGKDGESDVES